MQEPITIQGRSLNQEDLGEIRDLIRSHPFWHRTRLSRELCERWNWRRSDGSLKDMACRTMLLKLDRRELIKLPARVKDAQNHRRGTKIPDMLHSMDPIECPLGTLGGVVLVNGRADPYLRDLFTCFLGRYHYLGYRTTVGESMKYLAVDAQQRPLGCVLFGSSAWKCEDRDLFIGWDAQTRERNLNRTTNNTRFLILPWVRVKNLASHVLSLASKRVADDWETLYGHRPVLLETFVDRSRFAGTCYRAANWQRVGCTKGRSRQDRHTNMSVPVKDIYVYPLVQQFREELMSG